MAAGARVPWKVGATEKTICGRTWRHAFGFSIQDLRGHPVFSILYETEGAARQAESAIRKALEGAIDIAKG
jgi:hypothetical protein